VLWIMSGVWSIFILGLIFTSLHPDLQRWGEGKRND
jgi:hypothetical protein